MQNPPPDPAYSTTASPAGKSSMGLDANVAAALCYVLTFVTGLVFYLIEKESRYVRFHAMQAILLGAVIIVLGIVFSMLGAMVGSLALILWPIWLLLRLAFLVIWIICLVKAYQGKDFKLPIIGDTAANIVNK
jgi:uncharacterized membrane protein